MSALSSAATIVFVFPYLLITVAFVVSVAIAVYGVLVLPDTIAVHFDATGQPNGYMSKWAGMGMAVSGPLIAGIAGVFRSLGELDEGRAKLIIWSCALAAAGLVVAEALMVHANLTG